MGLFTESVSDPFVRVTLANQQLRTEAMKKTVNPQWDEELAWTVKLKEVDPGLLARPEPKSSLNCSLNTDSTSFS